MSGGRPAYFGWKIFAYRYYHDQKNIPPSITESYLLQDIHDAFSSLPNWEITDRDLLTDTASKNEVKIVIHGWDLTIPYDEGEETETYLCMFHSGCDFPYKDKFVERHKRLMYQTYRKLPKWRAWRQKAGGWVRNKHIEIVRFTNLEKEFEPFEITPKKRHSSLIVEP